MKKIKFNQGIAPILILLIVALLAGGSSAVYLKVKNVPISFESAKENILGVQKTETLDSIKIETGDMDFSLTSIPSLDVPSLNLEMPNMEVPKMGSVNTKMNINVPINKDSINIAMPSLTNITPTVSIPSIPSNIKIPTNIPTSIPTGATQAPANIPTTDTGAGSQGSAPSGAPSMDCSQFPLSNPYFSCSNIPDPQGQQACNECRK